MLIMEDLRTNRIGRLEPRPQGSGPQARLGTPNTSTQESETGLGSSQGDIDTAFQRLRTLLAFDGNAGPREGVKQRGFYLNILV